jgi:hypothetical protein|tara:strand:+ start:42 stop:200 length:159 start_codon:yes stop_codon:yes gene_type:complete
MTKEYIIEVENENTDTLENITEALNTFNIRAYVYENEEEQERTTNETNRKKY